MRGPHDVGGLPDGEVDTAAHTMTMWEKQIDALHALLSDSKRRIAQRGENRHYVEELGEDVYNTLTYYERWTATMCRLLIEQRVLTQDEIDERVALVRRRLAETGELETAALDACGTGKGATAS